MSKTIEIKYVKKGESISRTHTLAGEKVKTVATVAHPTGTIKVAWSFDFSEVTIDELRLLATKRLVVKMQAACKKVATGALDSWVDKTFNIREMIDTKPERSTKSNEAKFADAAKQLTGEQIRELLEQAGHTI